MDNKSKLVCSNWRLDTSDDAVDKLDKIDAISEIASKGELH